MSRKIILIKQELLLLVYELNRSGLLAENEKIRPILAQLEKQIGRAVQQECRDRKSGSAGMPRPISYAVFCLKKKTRPVSVMGSSASAMAYSASGGARPASCGASLRSVSRGPASTSPTNGERGR